MKSEALARKIQNFITARYDVKRKSVAYLKTSRLCMNMVSFLKYLFKRSWWDMGDLLLCFVMTGCADVVVFRRLALLSYSVSVSVSVAVSPSVIEGVESMSDGSENERPRFECSAMFTCDGNSLRCNGTRSARGFR